METRKSAVHRCKTKLHSLVMTLLSPFGEQECVRCGKKVFGLPLCTSCSETFLGQRAGQTEMTSRCRLCGRLLLSEIDLCSSCRTNPVLVHTDGVVAVHPYRFWKKDLMFAWKTLGARTLVSVFAFLMDRELCTLFASVGSVLPVVPVPPRKGKIRKKGWDQIEDLSRVLEKTYHHKVLRLLRRSTSIQQKKLDRMQRLELINGSYSLAVTRRKKRLLQIIPKAVVLIDDVLTTGSTLEHCAAVLKGAGVEKVYGITLFFA